MKKFVYCPSCHSLYKVEECIIKNSSGELVSQRCIFKKFPNHPQVQHRSICNMLLMKKFKLTSGKVSLQPHLVFCYKSIIETLQELVKRQGFQEMCESWRQDNQSCSNGVYRDIYDGKVWNDFLAPNDIPFLSVSHNYALQLNVDWFQPFDHTQHSEGTIYMSILNLPRHKRFLQEYILLIGIMPGPKEPHYHINSFLKPLVDELKQLWQGMPMELNNIMACKFWYKQLFYVWVVISQLLGKYVGLLVTEP